MGGTDTTVWLHLMGRVLASRWMLFGLTLLVALETFILMVDVVSTHWWDAFGSLGDLLWWGFFIIANRALADLYGTVDLIAETVLGRLARKEG
ncbi:hypothetical protein [Gordonia alkanivorans]|uniref:hypothetical protein n=1 Tax=Gordonia alkanivorans TaxID=84096 RepID=UPI0024B7FFAA|nr:hypothetical protein [Gordonia alkanivorans]MDJ0006486.1 hypothetical protein [Gordonia alkanivorans]MDJ0492114.1 hypothetical protein [Gordonia alkanivorans]